MKIGVVGYSGYIATEIINCFKKEHEIVKIGRKDDADLHLDLENPEGFDGTTFNGIDYLLYTAAVSGPDMCAKEYDKCWKINVESTGNIIREALNQGCKVLFFSSDAVYGDLPGKIYYENDVLQPNTPYGKMKCEIEHMFAGDANFKAIRLSYVVSKKDKFVSYCLKAINNGEEIEVFHPFYRSCTTLSDVIGVVRWCLKNWDSVAEKAINVCGTELVSRVRIVDEISRILNLNVKYRILKPEDSFFANRPKITQMYPGMIEKYSMVETSTFTEKLIKEFKMED